MEVGITVEGCKSCKINWPFSVNFWARIKFYSSKWPWEKSSSGSVRILESFVMKSINVEGDFFLWRVEFFKIGKRDFTFIREMRVRILSGILNIDFMHMHIGKYNFYQWIFTVLKGKFNTFSTDLRCWSTVIFFGFLPIIFGAFNI